MKHKANLWTILKNHSNEIHSNEIHSNEIRIRQELPACYINRFANFLTRDQCNGVMVILIDFWSTFMGWNPKKWVCPVQILVSVMPE